MLETFLNLKNLPQNIPTSTSEVDNLFDLSLPLHVHWKDNKGKYIISNSHIIRDTRLEKPEDIQGATDADFDFLTHSQVAAIMAHDRTARTSGQANYYIEHYFMPDNTPWFGICYKAPVRQLSKKIVATVAVCLIVPKKNTLSFNPVNQPLLNETTLTTKENLLTPRQLGCLYYLVKGMTMKQIGTSLNLSPRTVEHYLDLIKEKLNCKNRFELIDKALQMPEIKKRLPE